MKTTTISEAKKMENGMPIPRITGRLKMLWPRKTGSNDTGDWSMQSGILIDAKQDEIKFTLSGCVEMPHAVGTDLIFRANSGKRGLTGCKIKHDSYKGTPEPVLWITPTAMILREDEENDDLSPKQVKEENPLSPLIMTEAEVLAHRKSNPVAPVERPKPQGKSLQSSKETIMQMINLYGICHRAVQTCLVPEILQCTPEMAKDISTTLFIQCSHKNLTDSMPIKPITSKEESLETEISDKDLF